ARGPAIPDLLEEGVVPKDHQDEEGGVEGRPEVPSQAHEADGPGDAHEDQDDGQDPAKDQPVDEAGPHPRAERGDVDPHRHRLRGDDRVPLDTHARLTGRLTSRLMAPLILVAGGVAATWISTRSSSIIGPNGTAWSRPAPGEAAAWPSAQAPRSTTSSGCTCASRPTLPRSGPATRTPGSRPTSTGWWASPIPPCTGPGPGAGARWSSCSVPATARRQGGRCRSSWSPR